MANNTNTIQAYINGATYDAKGIPSCSSTVSVECKLKPLWWQERGLMYTATGYGARIPTRYMVRFNGKWRRVYARCYSNNATLYIGKLNEVGERLTVNMNA